MFDALKLETKSDGQFVMALTFVCCSTIQLLIKVISQTFVGVSKRGIATRISCKLVCVVFDVIATYGGLKSLFGEVEYPHSGGVRITIGGSSIQDPLYGFSPQSQFHFALAAGYFLWAAIMSVIYRGSRRGILQTLGYHIVYNLSLKPFMHGNGGVFLLFQASNLVVDLMSLSKLLTVSPSPTWKTKLLEKIHPWVFVLTRIIVGVPISIKFLMQMGKLLAEESAHSVPVVVALIIVNLFINGVNIFIAFGMVLGVHSHNLKFALSFGTRKQIHSNHTSTKVSDKVRQLSQAQRSRFNTHTTPKVSVPMISISIAVAAGIKSRSNTTLSYYEDCELAYAFFNTPTNMIALLALGSTLTLGKLLQTYGHLVFTEGTPAFQREEKVTRHLYTKIRNKWYDLARFEHPGGPIALSLARNRDATALFESHHYLIPHEKLMSVLKKYKLEEKEVQELKLKTTDPRDDGGHYVWEDYENDPFTKDVKKMVIDHFTPIAEARGISLRAATKASPQRWLMVTSLMAAFFTTLPSFFGGSWLALFATPQLAWLVIANYWHDCLHFSWSSDWRVNAIFPYLFPWLSSPWMWYHQHDIGHHAYTNVGKKDPDLAHAPQLKREHESIRWRKQHESQEHPVIFGIIWSMAVGFGLQMMSDLRANLRGAYNNVVMYEKLTAPRLLAHTLGRIFHVVSLYGWPFFTDMPYWKATIFAFMPITFFSWDFMLNSQINHLTEKTAHASDKNFLKHQIVTAQDFGAQNWWCIFFSGGLNMQLEHHCFPCVNHCHLSSLQPKLREICKKHDVSYFEVPGYREALRSHLNFTAKMGVRPFQDDDH